MLKTITVLAMMALSFTAWSEEAPDLQLENSKVNYWHYEGLEEPMLDAEVSKNIPPIADIIDLVAHGHAE